MMNAKKSYAASGKPFKPCAACPSPRKCRAAGRCAAKASKK